MPAVSKAQRRFMGYLVGNPAEAKRRGISVESAKHFASTNEKGLPEKVGTGRAHGANSHLRQGYHRRGK